MTKALNVTAIEHSDVRGKKLLYIKIEDLLINVGEKTFKEVQLLTGAIKVQQETPEKVTNMQIAEPLKAK